MNKHKIAAAKRAKAAADKAPAPNAGPNADSARLIAPSHTPEDAPAKPATSAKPSREFPKVT